MKEAVADEDDRVKGLLPHGPCLPHLPRSLSYSKMKRLNIVRQARPKYEHSQIEIEGRRDFDEIAHTNKKRSLMAKKFVSAHFILNIPALQDSTLAGFSLNPAVVIGACGRRKSARTI